VKAYVSSRLKYRARARDLRGALEAQDIRVTSAQDRSPGEVFLWLPEVEWVRSIPEAIALLTIKKVRVA
jgi:hypothetical protein